VHAFVAASDLCAHVLASSLGSSVFAVLTARLALSFRTQARQQQHDPSVVRQVWATLAELFAMHILRPVVSTLKFECFTEGFTVRYFDGALAWLS
jgi:hypothetical protein